MSEWIVLETYTLPRALLVGLSLSLLVEGKVVAVSGSIVENDTVLSDGTAWSELFCVDWTKTIRIAPLDI